MTHDVPTSRGFFGYGCDAVAGIISALILGFALAHPTSMLVLLAYTAAIPLLVVGFGCGLTSIVIATMAGTVGLLAAAPTGIAIMYFILYGFPATGLVYLSLRQRSASSGPAGWVFSEGDLFTALLLYPVVLFSLVIGITTGHAGGLMEQTLHVLNGATDQVTEALRQSGQAMTPDMTLKIQQYLAFMARIVPAIAMSTWLLVTILAAVAAQAILPSFGWGVRPAFTLEQLRIPRWVIIAMLACVAGTMTRAPYDYISLNLAILLSMPFFFTGVAVVHAAAARVKYSVLILILFYLLIAYLLPLVAILGAVDQWANFRKKLAIRQLPQTNQPPN